MRLRGTARLRIRRMWEPTSLLPDSDQLLRAQNEILERVATGTPLRRVLHLICEVIERTTPGTFASVLLLEGDRLRDGAGPSLPQAYREAIDGLVIGPNVGSCGTAATTRQRVIVEDVEVDERWSAFRALTREHGLRACWSMPIMASTGAVLGTFAVYKSEPQQPSSSDLMLLDQLTHLCAIAIERDQGDREKRTLRDLADAAVAIHASTSIEEVRTRLSSVARTLLGAQQATTTIFAEGATELQRIAARVGRTIRLTHPEIEKHVTWRALLDQPAQRRPARGWLACPLTTRGGAELGVIELSDKQDGAEFSETDELILAQLAHVVVSAIENVSLIDRLGILAALVEQSGDFIGVAHLDGRVFFVNAAGYRLVGLDRDSNVTTKATDFFFPDDMAEAQRILKRALETGGYGERVRLRHFQTGVAIPVWWHVFPITEPLTGRHVAVATVTRDLTAEEAISAAILEQQSDVMAALQRAQESSDRLTRRVAELEAALARGPGE